MIEVSYELASYFALTGLEKKLVMFTQGFAAAQLHPVLVYIALTGRFGVTKPGF